MHVNKALATRTPAAVPILLAILASMILSPLARAADLELQLARGKISATEYLHRQDQRNLCNRENTLAAIRGAVNLNRDLKKLYRAVDERTHSPENLCFRLKQANQYEREQIAEYKSRATTCHFRAGDLTPLIDDQRDTVRLMKRACSPETLGGPLPDILRFDEYKMPPFPE
jgi:hypothetical protein